MVMTNVAKFAAELKMPADVLLEQLKAAGVTKSSPDDSLTEADKEQLLTALRRSHGADDPGAARVVAERPPQAADVHVHDALVTVEVVAPHPLGQLPARDRKARSQFVRGRARRTRERQE